MTGKKAERATSTPAKEAAGGGRRRAAARVSGSSSGGGTGAAAADADEGAVVPASTEARWREVLAVPLPRRPLFPGGIMPVTVRDERLVQALLEMRRAGAQAYVGAFLRRGAPAADGLPAHFSGAGRGGADAAAAADAAEGGEGAGGADGAGAEGGASTAVASLSELYPVGTLAQVHSIAPHEAGGGAQLLLAGHRRLRATGAAGADPLRLSVLHLREPAYDGGDDTLRATSMELLATLKDLLHAHPLYNEQMRSFMQFGADFHDLSRLADLAASLTSADARALQAVLDELAVPERAAAALLLLKKEAEIVKLQADIGRRVEEKISKDQRRYFLTEQLRSIKKELGLEKDEKAALVERFRARLPSPDDGAPPLPEAAARVIEEELEKLSALEPASAEFSVTRNYLDWLTALPWSRASPERLDVAAARAVLDEDHHGLADVKDRILEFIAVGALRGSTRGKILLLVGPPGVGKTSVGRSIARALGRAYYRFSVGGLSDVAEVKGHRRTYVGAMPGKVVQALKAAGASNPLVLIDEVDKLGRGWQGDPAAALLELLDPEQNGAFADHYLDVPLDLSRVLFVCTANEADAVPGPLLDRMEVIRLSGYTAGEKLAIARRYLEPAAAADAGVPPGAVALSDGALRALVEDYAREAGVRRLKQLLERVYRKAALELVRAGVAGAAPAAAGGVAPPAAPPGAAPPNDPAAATAAASAAPDAPPPPKRYDTPIVSVEESDLKAYVGPPPYPSDKIYGAHPPPGVVTGLAWTPLGGATLYVEAAAVAGGEGRGGLVATGKLGEVMRESATIAHVLARRLLADAAPDAARFFAERAVHVHVPAGATPKDGPSAGAAVTTALLSLALGRAVRGDLAMTGEVTLTGRVLPVGGIKEKALAARRAGLRLLALPEGNRRDWEELGDEVRAGLEPHFVADYEEVFALAFGEPLEAAAAAAAAVEAPTSPAPDAANAA